jgi:hypothetical protein
MLLGPPGFSDDGTFSAGYDTVGHVDVRIGNADIASYISGALNTPSSPGILPQAGPGAAAAARAAPSMTWILLAGAAVVLAVVLGRRA